MSTIYRVVCGARQEFEKQVSELLNSGWEAVGGVTFLEVNFIPGHYEFHFAQAMVKKDE